MADGYGAPPPQYDQKVPEVNYGGYAPPPQPVGYVGGGPVVQAQPVAGGTTVVINQQIVQGVRPWKSGLFDCFDDMGICLCGTFCGLCMMCMLASDLQESKCIPICVPSALTAMRTKWRTQNRIEGSIMNDCLLETFCGPCAACQLAREVKIAKMQGGFTLN